MSEQVKLLFDENLGRPLVNAMAALAAFHTDKPKLCHLLDVCKGGKDEEWIPIVAAESWIIVSFDRGRRYGGQKLPDVCKHFKVTHVLAGPSVMKEKQFDKARIILSVLTDLIKLNEATKGSRFVLRFRNGKGILEPEATH